MSDSGKAVVGRRPLVFTGTDGSQHFVPLSAFQIDADGSIGLTVRWQEAYTNSADRELLVGLAQRAQDGGEIAAAPEAPSRPAVVFKAAVPGPEGNNIKVVLDHPAPEATAAPAAPAAPAQPEGKAPQLTVEQSEVFQGLTTAADAVRRIGTDQLAAGSKDQVETGLVQVKDGTAEGVGLPEDFDGVITGERSVKARREAKGQGDRKGQSDDKGVYFTLVLRKSLPKAVRDKGVKVTISVDPTAGTYDVKAVYTSPPHTFEADTVIPLTNLPESITAVVGASAPPRGYALPKVPQTLTLRGGTDGVTASAAAYTS
ncbi:hypothetical protein [Streptomyces sp. NPDC005549]|uniref:hypothetical protein n=1 Tax=Streptomyces sp. NPDC005549 TaxID=3154888 RepID=UPI0033ACE3A7